MSRIETFIAIVADLIRTLLIEVVSDRVRGLRIPRRLRGMKDVRRHLHRKTRRRLFNRLSTETRS